MPLGGKAQGAEAYKGKRRARSPNRGLARVERAHPFAAASETHASVDARHTGSDDIK
jgi:hypothetical protein